MTPPQIPFTVVTEDNKDALAALYATVAEPSQDDYTIHTPDDGEYWDEEFAESLARAKAAHPAGKGRTPAVAALHEAARIIDQRGVSYDAVTGESVPERSLDIIAELWGAYLGADLTPADAAAMMVLLKVGRLAHDPTKRDTHLDIMGYAALGLEAVEDGR